MRLMADDPMALAADALSAGTRSLVVTLGARGAVYFAAPGFEELRDLPRERALGASLGPVRTELVTTSLVKTLGDPTGCGDVWGATYFSRLLAGAKLVHAIRAAHRAAGHNVEHRGATGLAPYLLAEISAT